MIDTDKYEGHSVAPWKFGEDDEGVYLTSDGSTIWETSERGCPICAKDNGWRPYYDCITHRLNDMDKTLIADAPLILEAYKRLRDGIRYWFDTVAHREDDVMVQYFKRLIK